MTVAANEISSKGEDRRRKNRSSKEGSMSSGEILVGGTIGHPEKLHSSGYFLVIARLKVGCWLYTS